MNDLLIGHHTNKKGAKYKKMESTPWWWGKDEHDYKKFYKTTCLTYADFSLPFMVYVDASRSRLGAILYQNQGKESVVAYGSRSLRRPREIIQLIRENLWL